MDVDFLPCCIRRDLFPACFVKYHLSSFQVLAQFVQWKEVHFETSPALKERWPLYRWINRIFVVDLSNRFLGFLTQQKFDQFLGVFCIGSVGSKTNGADIYVGSALFLVGEE